MKAAWNDKTMRLTPAFILALLFGGKVTSALTNPNTPGEMDGYESADYQIVVDEGRRQLDNTTGEFEHVQGRAQSLLTVSLAVLAFATGAIGRLQDTCGPRFVVALIVFVAGLGLVVAGLGLAAAVIVVRADFVKVDTTQVSNFPKSEIMRELAKDYAVSVKTGAITVADRVTIFRLATRYTVWGAALTAAVYMLTA